MITVRTQLATLLVAMFALSACERQADTQETSNHSPSSSEVSESNQTVDEMETLPQQRPLNMTLPSEPPMEPGSHSELQADYSEKQRMPDLFKESDKKKSESRTKVGGKLITEEGGEDYFDSVKGAEVRIEMKMD